MRFAGYKRPLEVPCPRCGDPLRTARGDLPVSQRELAESACDRCRRRLRLAIGLALAIACASPCAWWLAW